MHQNPRECPYFQSLSRQQIRCTGIVPGNEIRHSYDRPGAEKQNYTLLCGSAYHRCPTAQMLNTLHSRFRVYTCPNNSALECLHPEDCRRCGWNPSVARDRLAHLMKCRQM